MKGIINSENISVIGSSSDSFLISETESVQTETTQSSYNGGRPQKNIWNEYDTIDNGRGRHKGARCRYCTMSWARGRAQEMKSHLAMKCKGRIPQETRIKVLRDIQNEDRPTLSRTSTVKKRKSTYSILSLDAYYDTKEAIDKTKEARANKSLIKWIVCSGISFSAFDSPYFEDFTKILNPGYNSPKRTALTTSVLEVEAANIMLKVEKELSKSKNLTLCIDGWCSPMKHSIYAFVIMTDERKQYVYSLRDFSLFSHTANFNAEKMVEVLEKIGPEKFVAIVSNAESAMMAAKRQIATKYPHILPIRCIAHHIQLISSSICRLPHAQKVLSNCQTIISFFRNSYTAGAALREEIICSFTVGGYLKSTTKTRWSTAWDSCDSILRNETNIKSVLEQEPQIFDRANSAKNLINDRQFWIDVEQLRNILGPVKRAVKNVEFRTTLLADVFVELVKMAIAIQETSVLYNNQFRRDCIAIYNKRDFLEPTIYKNHVLKKALEIWKQLGGGRTSADLLKTQMNLYRNQEHPFDDKFIATADTITNWWMSIDLKRNEDHDGTSEKDEQVENAKSELNYVNPDLRQEDFLSIFNKIADSIEDGTDLFSEEDSFSFLEELNNELMEEDTENTSDEQIDLVGENSVTLEVESFITLSSKLEYS
ncbi:1573_t:CDS:2, partial [Racocetra persica]